MTPFEMNVQARLNDLRRQGGDERAVRGQRRARRPLLPAALLAALRAALRAPRRARA